MWPYYCLVALFIVLPQISCQDVEVENTTTTIIQNMSSTPNPAVSTTTLKPENTTCEAHKDCYSCILNKKCYFCKTDSKCHLYTGFLPTHECSLNEINYSTCKVNFQVLIIGAACAVGVVLLIIIIGCCCCCKKKVIKLSKDEAKWARQREERKELAAEKRKERSERTEQIRQKYGLVKDNPYQRFDA